MIFGKSKTELQVGIFVFIGVIILAMFVLMIGKFRTWSSGYRVNVVFNFINGLRVGAPVRFAGLDVGEVQHIAIFFSPQEQRTKIKVGSWVRNDIHIPVDSHAWVNTLGLLGEKYLEIIPGEDDQNFLSDNQDIIGNDPLATHDVIEIAEKIADNIDDGLNRIKNKEGTVGKLLFDDALYKDLEAAMKNKEGTIGRLFYDDTIYKELESLIGDIRRNPWKLFIKTKEAPAPAKKR